MSARSGIQIDKKQFGKELRDLIFSKGYTSIYDFHKKSVNHQISYSSLKKTISGNFEMSISNLLNIADALDMSPKEFMGSFSFKRV
ncbi:MAG: hypothetical protein KDD94_10675 [Calditrichaeota bacterium]|nr:hypothetical protein [Calditrichota bacterium]